MHGMHFDQTLAPLNHTLPQVVNSKLSPSQGHTWISATCTELCTDIVILLQSLFKVENSQIVLAHGKMDTTKIIPEHASQAFT